MTALIYHRVGGGSPDERDVTTEAFREQMDQLPASAVVSMDVAVARLNDGDARPAVVLTFDDGFRDVYDHAWPILRERQLPFTIYLATAYMGREMRWEGSTAKAAGPALTWDHVAEMTESGLCTVGNHTHSHARPAALSAMELDRCSDEIETHLAQRPRHFAYTWGIRVPALESELRARFLTASTGRLGRNLPGADVFNLNRVPVRRSDPLEFFRAKLTGRLGPERAYAGMVGVAKAAGMRA